MAASDATAIPVKNQAYRVTFPLWDADGDLVTGATGLDSEISKDAGTFADCTNEATEIATSSGIYYLDLTSTEMNADTVAIIVKTSSSGAKTTPIILYPQEAGDINVDVTYWNGTAVASPDTAGYPKVTIKSGTGTGEVSLTSGVAAVNVTQISGDSTAADNAELFYEGAFIGGNVNDAGAAAGDFDGNAGLSATDDFYNGCVLAFTMGTLKGIARKITDYTGASKNLVFATAFPAAPANSDTFIILGRID